ncbi:MAG: cobalamin-dependent protein [Desulfobacterales bacterium]|nr:cobalamin-dependent protein [Desulfobacterales bacterium]
MDISFADLLHTGHSCNTVPYGAACVAAHAAERFGDRVNVHLFKHVADYLSFLESGPPALAAFSHYLWNSSLSLEVARRLKEKSPDTIVVFGGPNYPLDREAQFQFLNDNPQVDFHVFREGEIAFEKLFSALLEHGMDAHGLRATKEELPGCHYLWRGELIRGTLPPRIQDFSDMASPYLTGLLDPSLEKQLIPLLPTARGCPFSCSYCQEGSAYFNRVHRYPRKRIDDELDHVAPRARVPNLISGDSNLGMYPEDVDTCRRIHGIQKERGWPEHFVGIAGKNNKERVLSCVELVAGSYVGAAVQSTDPHVLKAIGRENVSATELVNMAVQGKKYQGTTFSEVILGLPGDTPRAHFKSICDLMDAGIDVVRSHQLIFLPGAALARKANREKYRMEGRFRVVPHTLQPYRLFGETFFAPEIDEICVSNAGIPFESYLECRLFNLVVEVFYNNGVFHELIALLARFHIRASDLIRRIFDHLSQPANALEELCGNFLRESRELWPSRKSLVRFLELGENRQKFMAGEMGNNEQMQYSAQAVFRHMDRCHDIAFAVAGELLAAAPGWGRDHDAYLGNLKRYSMARKVGLLADEDTGGVSFDFDFIKLAANGFQGDPLAAALESPSPLDFYHHGDQRGKIESLLALHGDSDYGLGNILSNTRLAALYRHVEKGGDHGGK